MPTVFGRMAVELLTAYCPEQWTRQMIFVFARFNCLVALFAVRYLLLSQTIIARGMQLYSAQAVLGSTLTNHIGT